jgi:hypothetical protein
LVAPVISPAVLADWFADMGTKTAKYFESLSDGTAAGTGGGHEAGGGRDGSKTAPSTAGAGHTADVDDTATGGPGVGKVHLRLISAFKSRVQDAADGDHYVVATVEGAAAGAPQLRTQTVTSSATPVFNRRWTTTAPHYKAALRLYLMDANTDRKVTPVALFERHSVCLPLRYLPLLVPPGIW